MSESRLERIRAVFFDLDGTLSDYVAGADHALDLVWKGVAARLSPHDRGGFLKCYWRVFGAAEELARRGEMTTVEAGGRAPRFARVLAELGVEAGEKLLEEMADLYTRGRLEGAKLFPCAAETLAALADRYTIGLITEGSGPNQREQIKLLGIADYFDHIIISHEVGLHKPDSALHRHALAAAGLASGEAVMVGDRVDWDLVPARAAGMRTILFTQKNMYMRLVGEMGFEPDWTVRSYAELRKMLVPA